MYVFAPCLRKGVIQLKDQMLYMLAVSMGLSCASVSISDSVLVPVVSPILGDRHSRMNEIKPNERVPSPNMTDISLEMSVLLLSVE